MGVDYNAVIAIGKTFYDKDEAQEYLMSANILSETDIEEIEVDGFEEWLYNNGKINGECLNCYTGDYYYIGFDISVCNPETFRKSFEEGMKQWNQLFPSVAPDVIKTVRIS